MSSILYEGTDCSRIAIVGAGIAGLNCAYQLHKLGQLITEVGGEFIDSNHREILDLVREFELPLHDLKPESGGELAPPQDVYFFGGKHYSMAETVEAFQPYAPQIAADIGSLPTRFAFDEKNAVAARFDELSIADYFDKLGMRGWIRALLEVAYLTEYGREVAGKVRWSS
jgi:monoamine oxidase